MTASVSSDPAHDTASRKADAVSRARWSTARNILRTEEFWTKITAPAALVMLCVVFTAVTPNFFTRSNIDGVLADSSLPVLLALGSTFVIALAGIDLSLASTVALSSVVVGRLFSGGLSLPWCCLAGVATGLAVGLVNGFFVGWVRIPDFIVTLGSLSFVMGLGLIFSHGKPVQIDSDFFAQISTNSLWVFRYNFLIALGFAVVLHVVLFRTRTGTHLLATGNDAEAARAMGIRVARVKLFGYALSGLMAGCTAVMLIAYVGASQPATNTDYLLKAIAAVVLGGVSLFGGRATIWGPVVGAVLLTALDDSLTLVGFSAFYEPVAVGIVVVAAATLMRGRR